MKMTFARFSLVALSCLFIATTLRAAEEEDLIATLQSGAGTSQKWAACQRLRMIGTAKAVPALAALLNDEHLSQAARHSLEGLSDPEAGAALRAALGNTSGLLKAGIIDSLGWRGEPSAVPLLAPLLNDSEGTIAATAAGALGRIGGTAAIEALTGRRDAASANVRPAILESLLKCAERSLANNDTSEAAGIYRTLNDSKYPVQVRTAAWRGLILSDPNQRLPLFLTALSGPSSESTRTSAAAGNDAPIHVAALKLLGELGDRRVIEECVKRWTDLPPDSQLAILKAQLKLGGEAVSTARNASQSPQLTLRVAAWHALGELNDLGSLPALAKAAAHGEPAERVAAYESLTLLRGPGARDAIVNYLEKAEAPEKAELLRAFGDRDDRNAVDLLLQSAASQVPSVRLAAIDSLTKLAPPTAVAPLLGIAAKSTSDEQRDPVLKALFAVCEASANKEESARSIVEAIGKFPPAERRQILPLLGELATSDALVATEAASRDSDLDLSKEAVRVLARWPNAGPAAHLLALARTSPEPTLQTLALRGAIEVAGQEPDPGKRLGLLQQALADAKQTDEQKQALGQIGQLPTPEALEIARKNFATPDLASEAYLAAISIAEKLAPSNPKLGDEVAAKVLDHVKEGEIARRAWALRIKPSSGASFIRDWVVCGPFREAGISGAEAVFKIAFGPETRAQNLEWKSVPPADHLNLAALFPGAENCVAYLRTRILAPEDCSAVLLTGSDDGIKGWLNGAVVLSKNVDRGEVVDQDTSPIKLKKGANELLLKVSQGGGGWSVSARIIGTDGKPISNLLIERPVGAAQTLQASRTP